MARARALVFTALLGIGQGLCPSAPLANTRWRVRLNVGRERGTWMPKAWGASEARLLVPVSVNFTAAPAAEAERLVGPAASTCVAAICGAESSFVSEKGEQRVSFGGGGWCVQRADDAPAGGEALLRFWVDCASGAARRDVDIAAGERIFFSTGVWDDLPALSALEAEYRDVLRDARAAERATADEDAAGGGLLRSAAAIYRGVREQEAREAIDRRARWLIAQGASVDKAGDGTAVRVALRGTLSVKRRGLLGEENHILGTFSMEPEEEERPV